MKKVEAPSKNPKKCPIICFAPDNKIISRTSKIRGALVFLCPKEREGEREREREREREKDCPSLRSGQFRGQKGLGPLEKPHEIPHYMFCPGKKK